MSSIQNLSPSQWALVCGAFQTLAGLALLAFPAEKVSAFLRAFPRDVWAGRVLAAVAWAGAAWAVAVMPLDFLRVVQQARVLVPLTAALAFLTCWWMPDLLACRAFSGILMLFPVPLLFALRPLETDWRLAPITYAYIALTWGMVVMFSPFHMRRLNFFIADRPWLQKTSGVAMLAPGLLFLYLAFKIFA